MEKRYRLRKNTEFNEVYKKGRNYWNRNLVIYVYNRNDKKNSKIGYTITKKIGNAVTRNKIRRRMKEIVRVKFPYIKDEYDIIFIPKKNIVDISYKQLESAVDHILRISKLYKDE